MTGRVIAGVRRGLLRRGRGGVASRVRGGVSGAAILLCVLTSGCAANPARSRRNLPPESVLPEYWLKQPAVARADGADFDKLWNACRRAVQSRSFMVDRVDLRGGVMTTFPQVSKQIFEFWRNDAGTLPAVMESTLGTVRRFVRVEVVRRDDGTFQATPKVVVERYAQAERRVTTVARYTEVLGVDPLQEGSRARDRLGADLPVAYWYALGRDEPLERQIAKDIERDLRS
jgi:hypothetical protein